MIIKKGLKKVLKNIARGSINFVETISKTTKKIVNKSADVIVETLDVDEDNRLDIEDIIILALKVPGTKIDREEFLKKAFEEKYDEEFINKAIKKNPVKAGMSIQDIDEIANEIIKTERNFAAGISVTLATQGGVAMLAAVPADLMQYYGYLLRIAQKLMYLYGFKKINVTENKQSFDKSTINLFTICFGVMHDIEGASDVLKVVARMQDGIIKKRVMKKLLTQGEICKVVENISKWFEERMVRTVISSTVMCSIPLINTVLCGGSTFANFEVCSENLKDVLKDTIVSNPIHEESKYEKKLWKKIETIEKEE